MKRVHTLLRIAALSAALVFGSFEITQAELFDCQTDLDCPFAASCDGDFPGGGQCFVQCFIWTDDCSFPPCIEFAGHAYCGDPI